MTPKNNRLLEEYEEPPADNISYVILIKHREIKKFFEGIKNTGVELI